MFHGYLIVFASFILQCVGIGMELSGAVFLIPFQTAFDSSRAQASMVESIYCSVGLLTSMTVGTLQSFLAKYYGEISSIKPIIAVGGLCISLGSFLISKAQGIIPVLLYALIMGIGIGFTAYTSLGICVQFFNKKNRGQMLLLGSCGCGCGSFALTKIIGLLLVEYTSIYGKDAWRVVIRRVGVVCGLVAISVSFIMRLPYPLEVEMHEEDDIKAENDKKEFDAGSKKIFDDTVDAPDNDNDEEEVKIIQNNSEVSSLLRQIQREDTEKDYGATDFSRESIIDVVVYAASCELNNFESKTDIDEDEFYNINILHCKNQHTKGALDSKHSTLHHETKPMVEKHRIESTRGDLTPSRKMRDKVESKLSLKRAIRTRTSISVFSSSFFLALGLMALLQHLPAFAVSIGLEEEQGTKILSWAGLAMLIGNVGFGFGVDCCGPIWMLRIILLTLTGLVFAWPYCDSEMTLTILVLIYGACVTVSFNLPLVILTNAFGAASPTTILDLSGLLNVITAPGYLFGPTIVGHLYDLFGDYRMGSIFAGTSLFLSFVSICFCLHPDEQKRRLELRYEDVIF